MVFQKYEPKKVILENSVKNIQNREILLFLCTDPDRVAKRILRFRNAFLESGKNFDFSIVSFLDGESCHSKTIRYDGNDIMYHIFGSECITSNNYPSKGADKPFKLIAGNTDLVTLLFWKKNPQYDRIWLMEDDVEYTGDPKFLFKELVGTEADLLATHLAKCPSDWTYVSRFSAGNKEIPHSSRWLMFLPFFRINRHALQIIDQAYKDGWSGHNEMTWPTILKSNNCSVVDIGGQGDYVSDDFRNKFYIGVPGNAYDKIGSFGTMRIRLRPGKEKNVLWHPIKTPKAWARQNAKRLLSIVKWQLAKPGKISRRILNQFTISRFGRER